MTLADVRFIRDLIAAHPRASRRSLSVKLCEAWNWTQRNGAPRDMVARGLMLALHRAGEIELPERRRTPANPLVQRRKPDVVPVDTTPLVCGLPALRPLEFRQVRRNKDEPLFNSLIEEHHYLGYTHPVGEHLKYLVLAQDRPVACVAWQSAPRHLGPRDRYIGWSKEARRRNIHLLAYNTRFLILPWVRVKHLASHVLGRMTRMLSREWQRYYGHEICFAETFVYPEKYRGTCYLAANWVWLGRTTGRGKDAPTKRPNRPRKDVLGYPLTRRFRERLGRVR